MPLASYAWLHWYGPGLGAAVEVASTPTAVAPLKGLGKLASVNTTSPTASARINDGRQLRAVHTTAPTAYARPSGKGRLAAVGKVNELSQDDVTGAVLESFVEDDLTLKQAIRLLLAAAQGNATGLEGASPVFKSLDGSKDRITATYASGTRTVTARDVT
jgi:hypothetical protein